MEDTYELSDLEAQEIDETPESKVSPLLGGAVVLLLIMIFVLIGLIVRQVFFTPNIPRTEVERALIEARAAVNKNRSNPLAHYDLGLAYMQLGQDTNAMESFNMALKLDKKLAEAHYQIGQIYITRKDEANAVKSFKKTLEVNSGFAFAHYQLATLAFEKKKYEEAAEYYKKTVEANSILADPYYYLGVCYEKLGKKDLAEKQYREALKYIPDMPDAKEALKRITGK